MLSRFLLDYAAGIVVVYGHIDICALRIVVSRYGAFHLNLPHNANYFSDSKASVVDNNT